jgi:hypothetical protein
MRKIILITAIMLASCNTEDGALFFENVYDSDTNTSMRVQVDCATGERL